MCGHGERAMTAASLLTARGHASVSVLDGGPDTWAAATGRPPRNWADDATRHRRHRPIRLGLRENLAQFSLLVAVNALVGGMIGQERTVLPAARRPRCSGSPRSPPR